MPCSAFPRVHNDIEIVDRHSIAEIAVKMACFLDEHRIDVRIGPYERGYRIELGASHHLGCLDIDIFLGEADLIYSKKPDYLLVFFIIWLRMPSTNERYIGKYARITLIL